MQNLFSLIKNFKEFVKDERDFMGFVKDEREASKKMFKKKDPSYMSLHFFKIKEEFVRAFVLIQLLRIREGVSSHEDIQLAL